jgi:hypothetical protein
MFPFRDELRLERGRSWAFALGNMAPVFVNESRKLGTLKPAQPQTDRHQRRSGLEHVLMPSLSHVQAAPAPLAFVERDDAA